MRVFLDTNVWLASEVFPGLCAELVIELDTRGHRLLSSLPTGLGGGCAGSPLSRAMSDPANRVLSSWLHFELG